RERNIHAVVPASLLSNLASQATGKLANVESEALVTWSIIARDEATGQIGIAVATRFFAVGARVPHIAAGIGGIATPAPVNPYYGIDGVRLLREGKSAQDIVRILVEGDEGRESRQLHVIDAKGRIAAFTGKDCIDWCGHHSGDGFSIAGNMLVGAAVLAE